MSHFSDHGKTYDYRGRYLVHTDASVQNQENSAYVIGDEYTDGSVGIVRGTNPQNARFINQADDVKNNTGIEVSGATIHIDHDLKLGSAGDWVRLTDADDSLQALVPHHEYSDEFGSAPYANDPILSPLRIKEVFQPDDSVPTTTTLHQWVAPPSTDQILIKTVWLRVGATGATSPVTVTFYKGTDATGDLFFTQNYPVIDFPANTEIELSLVGLADVFPGDVIYHEIESEDAFTLNGDASLVPWHGHSDYLVTEENIMTLETGLCAILTTESGHVLATEAGGVIYG